MISYGNVTAGFVYDRWFCIQPLVLYTTVGFVYDRWFCIRPLVLYTSRTPIAPNPRKNICEKTAPKG